MKLRVMLVCGLALLAISLGVSGCGGGGMDEGAPKDTTPGVSLDTMKAQMTPNARPPAPPKVDVPATTGTEEKK